MASVQYLFSQTNYLPDELREKQSLLNSLSKFRIICAVIIQKAWRGYYEWKKYQIIRKAIITIQSYCRGWLVRRRRAEYERLHKIDMENAFLNRMATIIQAAWRGYLVRKRMKGKTPKELLAERARIFKINQDMQDEIRKIFENNKKAKLAHEEEKDKNLVLYILFKCHHLLRTHQLEGIYSCHGAKDLSLIEQLMKALPLKDYMLELRKIYYQIMSMEENPNVYFFNDKNHKEENVLETNNESNKKCKCFHKEQFRYTTKICRKYEKKMFSTTPFEPPISNFEREEDKSKNICSTEFLLSPKMDLKEKRIPYFVDFWERQLDLQNAEMDEC